MTKSEFAVKAANWTLDNHGCWTYNPNPLVYLLEEVRGEVTYTHLIERRSLELFAPGEVLRTWSNCTPKETLMYMEPEKHV